MMIVLVCPGPGTTGLIIIIPGTTGLIIIIPGPACDDCVGMSWTRNYRPDHYYPRAGM